MTTPISTLLQSIFSAAPLNLDNGLMTRDGHIVTLLRKDAKGPYPLVGTFAHADGEEEVGQWTAAGRFSVDGGIHPHDIVNIPEAPAFLQDAANKFYIVSPGTGALYQPTTYLEAIEKGATLHDADPESFIVVMFKNEHGQTDFSVLKPTDVRKV